MFHIRPWEHDLLTVGDVDGLIHWLEEYEKKG